MNDHDGPSESVLRRIEGFAMGHQESGFEAGYMEAYTHLRRSLARRSLMYLLIGLMLGTTISFFWFSRQAMAIPNPPRDPLEAGSTRGVAFTDAAEYASYYTVSIQAFGNEALGWFTRPTASNGTGFFYDDAGHIVTNFHVVEGKESFAVTWQGRRYRAIFVGGDRAYDVAVLRVGIKDVKGIKMLENTDDLRLAEQVLAIGSPFGLDSTVTQGIVSYSRRFLPREKIPFIQTDSPINPGNSGGPLVNLEGAVVGMNRFIVSEGGDSAGLGFAIPIEYVRKVADEVIAKSAAGVMAEDKGMHLSTFMGIRGTDVRGGVRVDEVTPGTPADEAGLKAGDILLSMGPSENSQVLIRDSKGLLTLMATEFSPGDRVIVQVSRDGRLLSLALVFAAR